MKKVIIVSGATATGKTKISIELAKILDAEVVNFDSLVFYKELNIGTAKPTLQEMQDIPHHLVGTISINNAINAASFQKEAIQIINDIHKRNKAVILVGGSGFYLQTLIKGMYKGGPTSKEILNKSNNLYKDEGITPFLKELQSVDPESFKRYHENDHYRIRRAIEFYWSTGQRFSDERKKMESYELNSPSKIHNWKLHYFHLDIDKTRHFEIIQKRTNQMLAQGLIEEVQNLNELKQDLSVKPLNSIGYKETIMFLKGKIESKEALIERINISTRQLAKSQRTWFKKLNLTTYNPLDDWNYLIKQANELKNEN